MNKEEILKELYSLRRAGINPGLIRTRNLLKAAGNPEKNLKMIHTAGTNGKGSVCSMIASTLTEAGCKTGLYTSPHLLRFNERIRIDGEEIPDDEMLAELDDIMPYARKTDATFFEITTVLALKYFADKHVDAAVIETGMGGSYDSTNVITPLVSIITQIDYDHREYLGDTLSAIAGEKAGIIKPEIPVIIGDNHSELKELFSRKAESGNSPIYFCADNFKVDSSKIDENLHMLLDFHDEKKEYHGIELARAGRHQIFNLFAAVKAIDILKSEFDISDKAFRMGLQNLKKNSGLFGRIELLSKKPPLILDVSHNPGGIKVLMDTVAESPYSDCQFNIVFGVMADKDINGILEVLKPRCNELVLSHPDLARAIKLDELKKLTDAAGFRNVSLHPEVSEAVEYALKKNMPTIITGSFYTASEAISELEKLKSTSGIFCF